MTRYFLQHPDESITGPHDALEIAEAIRRGTIAPATPALREGAEVWQSAAVLCTEDGLQWKHWPTLPPVPSAASVPAVPSAPPPAPPVIVQQRSGFAGGCLGGLTGCLLAVILLLLFAVFILPQACTATLKRMSSPEKSAR